MAGSKVRTALLSSRREVAIPAFRLIPSRRLHACKPAARSSSHDERNTNGVNPDRDLLLSVLNASTTKRDAKAYLQQFKPSPDESKASSDKSGGRRLALVLLRNADTLEQVVLQGVARTLTQLNRLGLHIVLMFDQSSKGGRDPETRDVEAIAQADKLVSALQSEGIAHAHRLDHVLSFDEHRSDTEDVQRTAFKVHVEHSRILRGTIGNSTIPVIPPLAYSSRTQRKVDLRPEEIVLALIEEFTLRSSTATDQQDEAADGQVEAMSPELPFVVDRIIVLDPAGGLPSLTRSDKAHVFVNLEQEYVDIKRELELVHIDLKLESERDGIIEGAAVAPDFMALHHGSGIREDESTRAQTTGPTSILSTTSVGLPHRWDHLRNLNLIQQCLSLLPSVSSALLTTPLEAATFPSDQALDSLDLGVITRRNKNPLIFSLLTNKPTISSSLPISRFSSSPDDSEPLVRQIPATFFKQGMAVSIIPDAASYPWTAPTAKTSRMSLEDPRIDLERLRNLIEDSFNRPLDMENYMNRVKDRIAGVIVAGDYEGGAILTWELPPGVVDDGSEESAQRMVPYLDKFAVLKRSQGASGVADIVFSAMVRTAFPNGVCWRSRKNNPVNKWYFERSTGTWKLPGTEWSMFWTTPNLVHDKQRMEDYEAVCRSIQPSWADGKSIVD